MHETHKGKPILLAKSNGLGEISMCGCGTISLHLGNVTLRLESEALVQLERLVRQSLDNLTELAAQLPTHAGANQHVH